MNLNSRIKQKYDTYENWTTNNPILLPGEIAYCIIVNNNVSPPLNINLSKIGDGVTSFNDLPWSYALAADVYSWAKAETKPTYTAEEITNFTPSVQSIVSTMVPGTGEPMVDIAYCSGDYFNSITYDITTTLGNIIIGSEEIGRLPSIMSQTTNISNDVVVTADEINTVEVDANTKQYSIDDKQFSYRLKLGGVGAIDYRSVKLNIEASNCNVIIYCLSSNSSTDRELCFYDNNFELLDSDIALGFVAGNEVVKLEFTSTSPGTYYLASNNGGINIYGIEIHNPEASGVEAQNYVTITNGSTYESKIYYMINDIYGIVTLDPGTSSVNLNVEDTSNINVIIDRVVRIT